MLFHFLSFCSELLWPRLFFTICVFHVLPQEAIQFHCLTSWWEAWRLWQGCWVSCCPRAMECLCPTPSLTCNTFLGKTSFISQIIYSSCKCRQDRLILTHHFYFASDKSNNTCNAICASVCVFPCKHNNFSPIECLRVRLNWPYKDISMSEQRVASWNKHTKQLNTEEEDDNLGNTNLHSLIRI